MLANTAYTTHTQITLFTFAERGKRFLERKSLFSQILWSTCVLCVFEHEIGNRCRCHCLVELISIFFIFCLFFVFIAKSCTTLCKRRFWNWSRGSKTHHRKSIYTNKQINRQADRQTDKQARTHTYVRTPKQSIHTDEHTVQVCTISTKDYKLSVRQSVFFHKEREKAFSQYSSSRSSAVCAFSSTVPSILLYYWCTFLVIYFVVHVNWIFRQTQWFLIRFEYIGEIGKQSIQKIRFVI